MACPAFHPNPRDSDAPVPSTGVPRIWSKLMRFFVIANIHPQPNGDIPYVESPDD